MLGDVQLLPRQLWGPTTTRRLGTAAEPRCTSFELPAGGTSLKIKFEHACSFYLGVLVFNSTFTTTIQERVIFKQPCDYNDTIDNPGSTGNATIIGVQEPFYSSVSPQVYALATATVISYILVILIFITPRTVLYSGPSGTRFLSRGGVISGARRNTSVASVGQRPWLQKVAATAAAVSLTIATADTFRVAEHQYDEGFLDSTRLVNDVIGSLEIRIIQVISDTFLWLAQVQTLIRLFPRHREKVTIKWLGFALVSLDTIFSILDDLVDDNSRTRPRSFQDAIPALNYLFELAISLIYASCVIYYSLSKRRFAFWHSKMRNICLVALLSLIAVLIPVVFFVLDVSKPDVAGWGDYIRWVGAAAASVVVWEWVERIEALERDERKDGVLGREIFDGDEMLDDDNSRDGDRAVARLYYDRNTVQDFGSRQMNSGEPLARVRALHPRSTHIGQANEPTEHDQGSQSRNRLSRDAIIVPPIPAQPAASPISRSDAPSAASTVYAVRFHHHNTPSPAILEETTAPLVQADTTSQPSEELHEPSSASSDLAAEKEKVESNSDEKLEGPPEQENKSGPFWRSVHNPFKRKRALPPAEVADAQQAFGTARLSPIEGLSGLRGRMKRVARAPRHSASDRVTHETENPIPITVIPAQPRINRHHSPDHIQDPPRSAEVETTVHLSSAEHTPGPRLSLSGSSTEYPLAVTTIPAPKHGQRTWSPDVLAPDNTARRGGDSRTQSPT